MPLEWSSTIIRNNPTAIHMSKQNMPIHALYSALRQGSGQPPQQDAIRRGEELHSPLASIASDAAKSPASRKWRWLSEDWWCLIIALVATIGLARKGAVLHASWFSSCWLFLADTCTHTHTLYITLWVPRTSISASTSTPLRQEQTSLSHGVQKPFAKQWQPTQRNWL